MKNKRKSNYQLAYIISIFITPFMLNKKNEYICLYKKDSIFKEFTTTKHKESIKELNHLFMNVYRNQNTEIIFIIWFYNNWRKKGLLSEIEKRDDVLVNIFKSFKSIITK